MIFYSNTTTARLEGYARARGYDVGIVISPNNSGGRYFIVAEDGRPLVHWISLGWTKRAAEAFLDNRDVIDAVYGFQP